MESIKIQFIGIWYANGGCVTCGGQNYITTSGTGSLYSRINGKLYTFRPNETVELPADIANDFLSYSSGGKAYFRKCVQ